MQRTKHPHPQSTTRYPTHKTTKQTLNATRTKSHHQSQLGDRGQPNLKTDYLAAEQISCKTKRTSHEAVAQAIGLRRQSDHNSTRFRRKRRDKAAACQAIISRRNASGATRSARASGWRVRLSGRGSGRVRVRLGLGGQNSRRVDSFCFLC